MAGDAIQWLQDGLGIIREPGEAEGLAGQVPDTEGIYFVPPVGGSDLVRSGGYARGAILGITRSTTRYHVARAALEAMAYQTRDFFEVIKQRAPELVPRTLRADGRLAKSDFLLQFQADVLGLPVERPVFTNTAALGAGYLAGLAVGYWASLDEIVACWKRETWFEPRFSESRREELYAGWQRAIRQVKSTLKA
jgi:glycerol kinase